MKIAIRAEGGTKIGMGHIMRTLVLAKELSLKNEVSYICKDSIENKSGIIQIEKNGFKVYAFKDTVLAVLPNLNADVLITDSYDVNEKYFIATKKFVKHTAYIDDVNSFDYPVDLVVNQNINADDFIYKQKYKLLGLKYLMLRNEFRNIPRKHINRQVKDIMITMGGSDPVEFTKAITNWITDLKFNFHVIIGPSFKNIKYFENISFYNVTFYFHANMADVMQKCDLAVSASGSSIYEFLAGGVPCLSVVIANNQFSISKKLSDMNMVESLGWYSSLNESEFKNRLIALCNDCTLRQQRSIKGQKIIDGCGAKRIADFLNSKFRN
ncbi:UDP-2,4-diacetamido-2,4,6-trideoxy-beta-L-altropyranose hydrolase [Clostridium sp. Mt-5]|uniref:UDP-2,4-diacetamido-2,4, 6-trideoxy-beta-L-altropyranose hydrolase n=1 Tax=Clostridium moutaii TaxID=3240932 RepID=A0ABV4BJ26_9CLOT